MIYMKKRLLKKRKSEKVTLYIEQIVCGNNGIWSCCK